MCLLHQVTAALEQGSLSKDPDAVQQGGVAVSSEGGVSGPNAVQQAILLWTFQQCAYESRVRGVVGEEWEIPEDPFAPIIHANFSKTTVNASPLWLVCARVCIHTYMCVLHSVVGCKIREGFYLKEVVIKG